MIQRLLNFEELITTDTQTRTPASKRTIDSFFLSTRQELLQEESQLSTDLLEDVNLCFQKTTDGNSEECVPLMSFQILL